MLNGKVKHEFALSDEHIYCILTNQILNIFIMQLALLFTVFSTFFTIMRSESVQSEKISQLNSYITNYEIIKSEEYN